MNIGQIKLWGWGVAAGLTLGLCWYVFDFMRTLDEKSQPPSPVLVKKVLESVAPAKVSSDKLFTYDQSKRLVALVDWTGAPKAEVAVVPIDDHPPPVVVTPVKKLVRVLFLKYDGSNPEGSRVAVRYRPEAGVTNGVVAACSLLKVHDTLAAPHQGIKIESINIDSVTFSFSDSARQAETLTTEEFDGKAVIVLVGPDGDVKVPAKSVTIPQNFNDRFIPNRTTSIGSNNFKLGTEDIETISKNYPQILGTEVQTAQHRDPRSGKYDGIEIKSIQPGSIAERHGAREGDIVKSINGHPVNSTSEAITYVKTNSGTTNTWQVVVENLGKQRTVTYHSPNN